jgi:hypothetical protein
LINQVLEKTNFINLFGICVTISAGFLCCFAALANQEGNFINASSVIALIGLFVNAIIWASSFSVFMIIALFDIVVIIVSYGIYKLIKSKDEEAENTAYIRTK